MPNSRHSIPQRIVLVVFLNAFAASVSAEPATAGPATAGPVPDREVRSLRIAERVKTTGEGGGPAVAYQLVNDSPKTITAWDFHCVNASQQGGPAGQGGKGSDAYMSLRYLKMGIDLERSSLIRPGGRIRETIELGQGDLDGPLAGKTCGPTVVIFDDTSFEGPALYADSYFSSRAKDAVSAYRTRQELENALLADPLETALAAVAARRQRPPEAPGGSDFGARQLESFLEARGRGSSADLQTILGELDSTFQAAMEHLPRRWQRQVRQVLSGSGEDLPSTLADLAVQPAPAAASAVAIFDLDEQGKPASQPAYLVLDRDGDGVVDRRHETFDADTPQLLSAQPNGFRALAVFDDPFSGGNGDGAIDVEDSIYAWLQLWTDADRDGQSSSAELEPVASRIAAIELSGGAAPRALQPRKSGNAAP